MNKGMQRGMVAFNPAGTGPADKAISAVAEEQLIRAADQTTHNGRASWRGLAEVVGWDDAKCRRAAQALGIHEMIEQIFGR